jgi:hypothetical protein
MATTYDKIATTTLGSAAASISFTSIASSWTDLRIVYVGAGTWTDYPVIQFNSDSANNYSWTYVSGNGSAAQSGRFSNQPSFYPNLGAVSPELITYDIFSYAGSTYKTMLWNEVADNNGSGVVSPKVGLWRSTSAITRIDILGLYGTSNLLGAGTTATLYGIKAA